MDYGVHWTRVLEQVERRRVGDRKVHLLGEIVSVREMHGRNAFVSSPAADGATWTTPVDTGELTLGPSTVTVMNDGTHNIFVGVAWGQGVWRYIEP